MSLYANVEHLAAAGGIIALAIDSPEKPRLFRGEDRWQAILAGAINLLSLTGESSIRLVIGDHTMVVQHEQKETVAVVIPTGHAIAKSLRRMIRRMGRKDRGPYVPEVSANAAVEGAVRAPTPPKPTPQTVGPGMGAGQASASPPKPGLSSLGDPRFSS